MGLVGARFVSLETRTGMGKAAGQSAVPNVRMVLFMVRELLVCCAARTCLTSERSRISGAVCGGVCRYERESRWDGKVVRFDRFGRLVWCVCSDVRAREAGRDARKGWTLRG